MATVVIENLRCPVVGAAGWETHLGYLEPGRRRANSSGRVRYFGHVDIDRAIMVSTDGLVSATTVSGLLMHLYCNGVSRVDGAQSQCGVRIDIASEIIRGDIGDRVVRLR